MDNQLIVWYVLYGVILLLAAFIVWRGINTDFYKQLVSPTWQPSFLAAIIISIIVYGLSYAGLYIMYTKVGEPANLNPGHTSFIFAISLLSAIIGLFWFLTFFNFQGLKTSLFVLAALIGVALYYTYLISQYTELGAALQIPFILWLGVYLALNADYVNLNPTLVG